MNQKACSICCERPVWAVAEDHGYDICEHCAEHATNIECEQCGNFTDSIGIPWTPGYLCSQCEYRAARNKKLDWISAVCDEIQKLADKRRYAYDVSIASTDSHYITLGLHGIAECLIRVADHGECYCREDISIEYDEPINKAMERIKACIARKLREARKRPAVHYR